MLLHQKQKQIVQSNARFKVVRAGRRSGKSTLEIEVMLFHAISKKNRRVFYLAPTQKQARSIIWESLKARVGNIGETNESRLEMTIPTKDGGTSTIYISGWENRENFRGMNAHHITFDELDTMKDFFIGWKEIFRPALIDTGGSADFIGTPKKENPNLRRLEKEGESDYDWETFVFSSYDNPHLPRLELDKAKDELDKNTYRQEILAEYVEDIGALFRYTALVDMFTNTVTKKGNKYLTVDVAGEGEDKTIFTRWEDWEAQDIQRYQGLRTHDIITKIREMASEHRIPMSHITVDAIGEGSGVASSPLLDGVIPFKSSYGAIKTDKDITRLPNVHYTKDAPLISEYKNLRSQCTFMLADKINKHEVAIRVEDEEIKSQIIDELSTYQDASKGDGKRMATPKDEVKELIGRSPDISDTLIMRVYFQLQEELSPYQSEEAMQLHEELNNQFARNEANQHMNNTR